jgi:hypothetical protein
MLVIVMLITHTASLIRALTQQQADSLHSVFDGTAAIALASHAQQLHDSNTGQRDHCKPACFTPAVIEQLCSEHENVS